MTPRFYTLINIFHYLISGPSQLIDELQGARAIPQAPVYATIRPSHSPNRNAFSMKNALNSQPPSLSSTNLVKTASPVPAEEPLRFHPTNPFYSTLPSNTTSASKLPIPNGKTTYTNFDRSKSMNSSKDGSYSESEYMSNSYFSRNDSDLYNSVVENKYSQSETNGYNDQKHNFCSSPHTNGISYLKGNFDFSTKPNLFSMFDKEDTNPFENYAKQNGTENIKNNSMKFPNSHSENNLHQEEISRRSIITEHKVDQVEEVKTIKKIILNGSNEKPDRSPPLQEVEMSFSSPTLRKYNLILLFIICNDILVKCT